MSYKVYSGTGTVYVAPVTSAGVKTAGYRQVGDAYPLAVQVATKKTEVKSRMVERAGQIIASKVEIDTISGKLTLREWNAANLAWALSGLATDQSASGGSVDAGTPEAVTALPAGQYAALAHRNVSSVVVKDVTDTTTYVADTDYTLDARLGLITIIAAGDIEAEDVLHVSYTYAAKTDYSVAVGSSVQIRVAILAHLYDEYRDEHYELEIDSAILSTNSEINFISEEGSTGELLQFDMTLETLSGQTSPARVNGVPI